MSENVAPDEIAPTAGTIKKPKGLTPSQRRAIAALLLERDNRAAAKASGIAERTLARWLTLPIFREALEAAETEAVDSSLRRLASVTGLAVDTLLAIMENPGAKPAQRLTAANIALSRYPELRDSQEFNERLRRLENEFPGGAE